MLRNRKTDAQTLIEYTIVIGIIIVVLFAMTPLIKRATQGMIKIVADEIGNQEEADQTAFRQGSVVAGQPTSERETAQGYLKSSYSAARNVQDQEVQETAGTTSFIYDDKQQLYSNTLSNLGFTKTLR